MKSNALKDTTTQSSLLQAFADCGIADERIELRNAVPFRKEHMKTYADIDIALDPFPYNGTTTTCEALWMGVPVITLQGARHAGRVGTSLLQHADCQELIADSESAYLTLATALANDKARLAGLRQGLRDRLRNSALMNLPQFTHSLEAAYRQMWVTWCNRRS